MKIDGNPAGGGAPATGAAMNGAAPDSGQAAGDGAGGVALNGGQAAGGAGDMPPAGTETARQAAPASQAESAAPGGEGVVLTGKDDTGTGGDGAETGGGGEGGEAGADGGGEAAPFAYPEGMAGDPEAESALREFAKGKNLAAEDQQALVDIQVALEQKRTTMLLAEADRLKKEWADALAADPEFGGPRLEQTGKDANLGLRHYAPELIPLLAQWNLDRNDQLIRHFARLGRGLRENRSPRADNPGQHRPKTLVDAKAAMLAGQERAAAAR